MADLKLSVIGLGKLGAVLAAVLAEKGYSVTGADINARSVDTLNRGEAPVDEPGLPEMVARNRERLRATTDLEAAVRDTDVTFIIVPTPSGPDGTFGLDAVLASCRSVGNALRSKSGYHVVVISSTVMPGSTGGPVRSLLEEVSGKSCGSDFGLCYNPEFIALGSVIRDMLHPDMLLVGQSDERAGEVLEGIYRSVCNNRPPVMRMNFVNAEITKISVNTYVTTKISYANMLAQLCEQLPGADVDVVTSALGLDTRIGIKYLKGALGYGGPCFPRDNVAFAALARSVGVEATLAEATDQINRRQAPRLGDMVIQLLPHGGTAGILGLSYKPGTSVVEESPGVALARYLADSGVDIIVFDPAAVSSTRAVLGGRIRYASSVAEVAQAAHVLTVTQAWPEFQALRAEDLRRADGKCVLIDCWRLYKDRGFDSVATYLTLGVGAPRSTSQALEVAVAK